MSARSSSVIQRPAVHSRVQGVSLSDVNHPSPSSHRLDVDLTLNIAVFAGFAARSRA